MNGLEIVLDNLDIIINCKHHESCKSCKYSYNNCMSIFDNNNYKIFIRGLFPSAITIVNINNKEYTLDKLIQIKNLKSL